MKGATRTMLGAVLAGHIVGVIVILIVTATGKDSSILESFGLGWIKATVLVNWIDYFIPITLSGIILAFSLFIGSSRSRAAGVADAPFVRVVSSSIGAILVISALYIVLVAFVSGTSMAEIDDYNSRSHRVHEALDKARDLIDTHKSQEALVLLDSVRALAPDDMAVSKLRDEAALVKQSLTTDTVERLPAPKTSAVPADEAIGIRSRRDASQEDYGSLLEQANELANKEDYFSALYIVDQAERELVASGRKPDGALVSLRTRIEAGIRGAGPRQSDKIRARLYEIKQNAIVENLENGRPDEAYYLLKEAESLYVRLPPDPKQPASAAAGDYKDPDVRKWMPEVEKALLNVMFFEDEVYQEPDSTSSGSLFVLNKTTEGLREYLYAQSVVKGKFNYYLVAPEIIEVDSNGKLVTQRSSKYGKIVGNRVLLKAIAKDQGGKQFEAQLVKGSIDPNERNLVTLSAEPDALWNLAESRFGYRSMSFPTLLAMLGMVESYGYDPVPVQAATLEYFIQALSLASLAFFCMGWAWTNRSRYLARPVLLTVLMVALVPACAVILYAVYLYVYQALAAGILSLLGFETALIVLLVLQGGQIAASLFYIAGQPSN